MCYIAGEDFNGNLMTVNIPAGVTMQSFTINITNNNIVECNEIFNVAIVSVTTCGVAIGNNNRSEVIIIDDDSKWNVMVCVVILETIIDQ